MKKSIYIFLFAMTAFGFGCKQSTGLMANQVEGTSKWVIASYLDKLNNGEYEQSLLFFLNPPVANGELTMNEYVAFADNSLTKQKTISAISLSEKVVAEINNTIEMYIEFTYLDGSNASKWVQMQQADGIWKLTTRGSLF